MIFRILIGVNILLIVYILTYYVASNIKFVNLYLKEKTLKLKVTKNIRDKLKILSRYSSSSKVLKRVNALMIIFLSVVFSLLIYFICIFLVKTFTTSLLLALIALLVPYFVIDIILQRKVGKIKTILPSYIVNLKSNIEVNNNIIKSISITKVEEPLKHSIDIFNTKVSRGINVYECFDELKQNVNIENFMSLIDAFKVCYANGGDYTSVLNKYIDITSKENMEKAKLRENSNSTIITLILMIVINIFLMFSVILQNNEYSKVILETVPGHIIINFGIISYSIVAFFVYRIYKMEG